jgi:WS/DGAT/MGAT family acyltransferase
LTQQETFFVGGETDNVYQHTGGLVLLDVRDRPGFGYETFRRHLEERIGDIPHFRWKLHEVPLGLDLPYWVEDEHFSFDHHIRRIAVPSPGDRAALAELVAYLYSRHLDRKRPLWETWFVEGLGDGQFALVQKLHHCLMDGEGASKLGERLIDLEPDAPPRPVDPAISEARAGSTPSPWRQSFNMWRRYMRFPAVASREVIEAVTPLLRDRIRRLGAEHASPPVPVAHFNGPVGRDRVFVFGSLPLPDIKAVKSHFDVTLNDVVMALVGTSLRAYLAERDLLPDDSLRATFAVSLRTDADDEFSNRITTASTTLATDQSDLAARLRAIGEDSERAKVAARGGGKGIMEHMQILPPVLVGSLLNMGRPELVLPVVGGNLMVSNVRGSPLPMYMAGARATGIYPVSIIAPGSGLNVTCISYVDNLDFGITAEPSMFPDLWPLLHGLQRALDGYLALTRKRSARRKPGKAKTRVGRKARPGTKKRS